MAEKAKPGFYVAVIVVIFGLISFAFYRYTHMLPSPDSSPTTAIDTTTTPTETPPNEREGKLAASTEIPNLGPPGTYQLQGETLSGIPI